MRGAASVAWGNTFALVSGLKGRPAVTTLIYEPVNDTWRLAATNLTIGRVGAAVLPAHPKDFPDCPEIPALKPAPRSKGKTPIQSGLLKRD